MPFKKTLRWQILVFGIPSWWVTLSQSARWLISSLSNVYVGYIVRFGPISYRYDIFWHFYGGVLDHSLWVWLSTAPGSHSGPILVDFALILFSHY
jgi:hypothetical protein